jgi:hypothetical protein
MENTREWSCNVLDHLKFNSRLSSATIISDLVMFLFLSNDLVDLGAKLDSLEKEKNAIVQSAQNAA